MSRCCIVYNMQGLASFPVEINDILGSASVVAILQIWIFSQLPPCSLGRNNDCLRLNAWKKLTRAHNAFVMIC